MSEHTTVEDMDFAIARLLARKVKWGLTQGEERVLQSCYTWLKVYYS